MTPVFISVFLAFAIGLQQQNNHLNAFLQVQNKFQTLENKLFPLSVCKADFLQVGTLSSSQ